MGSKVWTIVVVVLTVVMLGSPLISTPSLADGPKPPGAASSIRPYIRYRMPARGMIEWRLRQAGRISADSTEAEIAQAVREWQFKFAKVSPSWARPEDRERALANELAVLKGKPSFRMKAALPLTASVLVIPVEFDSTETLTFLRPTSGYTACITVTETFTGPLHGNIPYPGVDVTHTIDNNTAYYPSTEVENYEKLIFSRTGITEPLRPGDPNVGDPPGSGVDISGLTVQTYYDAQSDNTVVVTGTVAPWVPVTHTEAYYGIDQCIPGLEPPATADGQLGRPADLVVAAAEALKAQGAPYDTYDFWKQFDNDDDGWIDTLWIIHAGRGQEAGGGAEGEDSIWSHSSNLIYYTPYENGYVIHDNGTVTTTDDLKIGPFTFQPEDSDLGVLSEEFGHNFFGLPDLYTLDSSNSVGWWSHMSAGSWGGELGGVRPVNMPLWFRMVADCGGTPCGWADPVKVISYTTAPTTVVIGQAGVPAGGIVVTGTYAGETIYEGVRIDLPDQIEEVPNMAGTGKGAYSTSGDMMDNTLDHVIDLTGETGPITLTVDAYWDIEEDWDYGYVEVSTDTVHFVSIDDLDGILRETNPNGNNLGHGLTGFGFGTLRFDLSAYAGQVITLRFRYRTDPAVSNPGWWIDNVAVASFSEDFESSFSDWTNNGWREVPYTAVYPHYYLVEWRNSNGFDKSLLYPYNTNYADQDEWRVDRVPANVPGAVVMYRNTKYDFSYTLDPQLFDPPSIGSKYGLLVVDTNFWPVERPSRERFSGRLQSLDAPLALQDQPDFTLEVRDPITKGLLFTETIAGGKGITRFNDALGYYPGLFYGDPCPPGYLCFWDWDASVVIPSRGGQLYSTRVTDYDKNPLTALYGIDLGGGHYLGSGNPGDANVQYGVHIELLDKAADGSWGVIRIYNGAVDYDMSASTAVAFPGTPLTYTVSINNRGSVTATVQYTTTLPSYVTLASGSTTWSGTISPSAWITHNIVVTVSKDVPSGADLSATTVFYDGTDVWERTVGVIGAFRSYLPIILRNF